METGEFNQPGLYSNQRGPYPRVPEDWVPQPPYYEEIQAPSAGLDTSILKSYLSDSINRLAKMGVRGYLLLLVILLIVAVAIMAFLIDKGVLCNLYGLQKDDDDAPFWPSMT